MMIGLFCIVFVMVVYTLKNLPTIARVNIFSYDSFLFVCVAHIGCKGENYSCVTEYLNFLYRLVF